MRATAVIIGLLGLTAGVTDAFTCSSSSRLSYRGVSSPAFGREDPAVVIKIPPVDVETFVRGGFDPESEMVVDMPPQGNLENGTKISSKPRLALSLILWHMASAFATTTAGKIPQAEELPVTMAAAHAVVGTVLMATRRLPLLSSALMLLPGLLPITLCNAVNRVLLNISFRGTGLGFSAALRASEPLVTAFLSMRLIGDGFSRGQWATLLPIVVGIAMCYIGSSISEIGVHPATFAIAVASTLASSLKTVLAKAALTRHGNNSNNKNRNSVSARMSPAHLNAIITVISAFALTPLARIVEGRKLVGMWKSTAASPETRNAIIGNVIGSGVCAYLHNELLLRCLEVMSPVAHSISSKIGIVPLLYVAPIMRGNKVPLTSLLGSVLAASGTVLYGSATTDNISQTSPPASTPHFPSEAPNASGGSETGVARCGGAFFVRLKQGSQTAKVAPNTEEGTTPGASGMSRGRFASGSDEVSAFGGFAGEGGVDER